MKTILKFNFLILLLLLIVSCNDSKKEKKWQECKSVKEGKELVDYKFTEIVKNYNELCGLARNENTKEKFKNFTRDIEELHFCCYILGYGTCLDQLAFEDQNTVIDYALSKIESNSGLNSLLKNGVIECW